jgi:hypothetical protein
VLVWQIADILEEGSSVLSFSSEKLSFDDIFPLDVRFDETYSLIDLKVQQVTNIATGDPLSLKEITSLSTETYKVTSD